MDSIAGSHSFIIRIWYEPREIEHMEPNLRGTIEHVGSGKRLSFIDLERAVQFIRENSAEPRQSFGKVR